MPMVDALATIVLVLPLMPGAVTPGLETLAGASIAWFGMLVPSGRERESSCAAAVVAPAPARLAVQAVDSNASGTSADAFCNRPNFGADISASHSLSRNDRARFPHARCVPIQRMLSRVVTSGSRV